MINKTFIKYNPTKQWLEDNHFYYYYKDGDDICYRNNFPVYRDNGGFVTLECRLVVWFPSGKVAFKIVDSASKGTYCTYYCREFGDSTIIIDKINSVIKQEFIRLGIKECKHE